MWKDIINIRWWMDENDHGKISFDYHDQTYTFTEPVDVVLDDNDASRKYIWNNYGFLLACV